MVVLSSSCFWLAALWFMLSQVHPAVIHMLTCDLRQNCPFGTRQFLALNYATIQATIHLLAYAIGVVQETGCWFTAVCTPCYAREADADGHMR